MPVEDVMLAGGDERYGLGLSLHSGGDHRRRFCVLGEEIVPSFEHDGMDEHDLAGNITGLCEVGGTATARVDHRHMLYRSQRGRPRDGNAADAERSVTKRTDLKWNACVGRRADRHLRSTFRPRI